MIIIMIIIIIIKFIGKLKYTVNKKTIQYNFTDNFSEC